MTVHSTVEYRTQIVNLNLFRCITSSIFNDYLQKIHFRVKPSAVGSVIALQQAVRLRIFVFVAVLKGPSEYPGTVCLRRWCVSVFIQDVCVCLCAAFIFYVPVLRFM